MITLSLPRPTINGTLTEDRSGRLSVSLADGPRRRTIHVDIEAGTARMVQLVDAHHGPRGGCKVESCFYWLDALATDFGHGWRLRKFSAYQRGDGDSAYDVMLNAEESSCECKGFLRHQHCKHLEALAVLKDAGLI
jgi:hypothetical protein